MRESKKCFICGTDFIPKKKTQQCCSAECANKKAHEATKKYYSCKNCGKPFWRQNAFRMKYCSKECLADARKKESEKRAALRPQKMNYEKVCEFCSEIFSTPYPNKKYCCESCAYEGMLALKRKQWLDEYVPKTIVCKECGTEFTTECGDTHSVFCCQTCADKFERRIEHATERHKYYMKRHKEKRVQQIKEMFVEEVDYDALYKRDRGICGICGLPVIYDKNADNDWSGTIDHIVPLSAKGEHSMRNCQLAHRVCNSIKGKETENYQISWKDKSKENNYWKIKYKRLADRYEFEAAP